MGETPLYDLIEELCEEDVVAYYGSMAEKDRKKFIKRNDRIFSKNYEKIRADEEVRNTFLSWVNDYADEHKDYLSKKNDKYEEFGELLTYTSLGAFGGLALGYGLDAMGIASRLNSMGNFLLSLAVRTTVGGSDSIVEYISVKSKKREGDSDVDTYASGKIMTLPVSWGLDALSQTFNFTIPKGFVYSQLDQTGAVSSLFIKNLKKHGIGGVKKFFTDKINVSSLGIVTSSFLIDSYIWASGFRPNFFFLEGLETLFSLACLLPPSIGFYENWKAERGLRKLVKRYKKLAGEKNKPRFYSHKEFPTE